MAYTQIRLRDKVNVADYMEFVCDYEQDVMFLPSVDNCAIGSTAFVIDTSVLYMLGSDGRWYPIPRENGEPVEVVDQNSLMLADGLFKHADSSTFVMQDKGTSKYTSEEVEAKLDIVSDDLGANMVLLGDGTYGNAPSVEGFVTEGYVTNAIAEILQAYENGN